MEPKAMKLNDVACVILHKDSNTISIGLRDGSRAKWHGTDDKMLGGDVSIYAVCELLAILGCKLVPEDNIDANPFTWVWRRPKDIEKNRELILANRW